MFNLLGVANNCNVKNKQTVIGKEGDCVKRKVKF